MRFFRRRSSSLGVAAEPAPRRGNHCPTTALASTTLKEPGNKEGIMVNPFPAQEHDRAHPPASPPSLTMFVSSWQIAWR